MEHDERRQNIISLLEHHRALSVKELAAAVYASEASVRRDIDALEKAGIIRRVYGGVMLSTYANALVPLAMRDSKNSTIKEVLAKQAAMLVEDNDTIMMDASSTVRRMLKYLASKKNLTIITNNERIFSEAALCDARLICVGGTYIRQEHDFLGTLAEKNVASLWADKLFFSSQYISNDGEISDNSEETTSLRRAMLQRVATRVFLFDSSKLGKHGLFTLCGKDSVDRFICDCSLPWK